MMQAEIDSLPGYPGSLALPVAILGVNEAGQESGNDLMTAGRTIPWLQDVAAENVWEGWHVTYRDVVILNAANEVIGVYNLTEHDLSKSADYAALKKMLLDAAGR